MRGRTRWCESCVGALRGRGRGNRVRAHQSGLWFHRLLAGRGAQHCSQSPSPLHPSTRGALKLQQV